MHEFLSQSVTPLIWGAWNSVVKPVTAPSEVRDRIREFAESVPGVDGIDLLRVRQSGLALWVDIHVEVEGEISVREGHEIAHRVKDGLLNSDLRILDALVHVEPTGGGPIEPTEGSDA